MKIELKKRAVALRRKGHSIKEVAKNLNIAQSTVSSWLRNIKLSKSAQIRLDAHSKQGALRGVATNRRRSVAVLRGIRQQVSKDFHQFDWTKEQKKLACALIFWAEGSKMSNCVGFTNSDPKMLATFINLLRDGFNIDESKLRLLIHIHEYHNDLKQRKFWSKVTGINIKQFNKSYIKPHTGKNKRKNYPGCASLRYYDYKVAIELTEIYKFFSNKFRRVA
ncbi:MAG: helix-turn-helix domain-containing protein [Patescibacteria group bacterium]